MSVSDRGQVQTQNPFDFVGGLSENVPTGARAPLFDARGQREQRGSAS